MAAHNPIPIASIQELRIEQARLRQGLFSPLTTMGYNYDFLMFCAWAKSRNLDSLPCTSDTLSLYLTDLLVQGHKISTARRRRCAIIHEHRIGGYPSPNSQDIKALLRGAQRIRGEKPRQMRPITVMELRKISAELVRIGTPKALMHRALMVFGFATALRRSSLAALNLSDVKFVRKGLEISVQREKQDQTGKGRLIGVMRGRNANTDPVRVLKAWLRVRGTAAGPLFPRLSARRKGEAMTGGCIYRIVKKCLSRIGPNSIQTGPHSLRSGLITALAEANVTALRISAFTGQSPEIVKRYFRRTEVWRNNAGAKLGL